MLILKRTEFVNHMAMLLTAGMVMIGACNQIKEVSAPDADAGNADAPDTMVSCESGQHICGSICVSNLSAQTCGASCVACDVPEGGEATCNGIVCGPRCPEGLVLCGSRCVKPENAVNCSCLAGKHACEGFCVDDSSVNSCGVRCAPCVVPTYAEAACDGVACVWSCQSGFKKCGEECIPNAGCCLDGDCTGRDHATVTCDTASHTCAYRCAADHHTCGQSCVSNGDVSTCGMSCVPCQAPEGGTVSCNGSACVPACPPSQKICAGKCIAQSSPCAGQCSNNDERVCPDNLCRKNDISACGSSCAACTAPTNGAPTCDGSACRFTCGNTYRPCNDTCIAAAACCAATETCTPPTVTSVSPSNGAAGLPNHTEITIKFSKAMSRSTVVAAFSSANIPYNPASFNWNTAGTELIIVPTAQLEYAQGAWQGLAAKTYSFKLSTTAKDLQGLALDKELNVTFSTLRQPHRDCPAFDPGTSLTGNVNDFGPYGPNLSMTLYGYGYKERVFVSFDCAGLPAELQTISNATLELYLDSGTWQFGQWLVVEPISFTKADLDAKDVYLRAPLAAGKQLTPSGVTAVGAKSMDVTDWVRSDFMNRGTRGNRSQFRIRFHAEAEFNGNNARLKEDPLPSLRVTYLIP